MCPLLSHVILHNTSASNGDLAMCCAPCKYLGVPGCILSCAAPAGAIRRPGAICQKTTSENSASRCCLRCALSVSASTAAGGPWRAIFQTCPEIVWEHVKSHAVGGGLVRARPPPTLLASGCDPASRGRLIPTTCADGPCCPDLFRE